MKICYFGIHDPGFTRSRVIVKGLTRNGVEVVLVNDRTPSFRKYLELSRRLLALKGRYDAILVGFPGYFTVFLAKLLSSKPILFDAYISYYDGLLDRRSYSPWHPKALFARCIDFLGICAADSALTINDQYKKFFIETIGAPERKMRVLRKGADTDLFRPQPMHESEEFRVGWWGSFIPLHGLRFVLDAAEELKGSGVRIELIGRGQLKNDIEAESKRRGIDTISILPPVSYEDLPRIAGSYDIVLGIFNDTPKALRCITNKVYEALALGKPVITEDSPASREILAHGSNAYLVPPGDSHALAEAIRKLKEDAPLRAKIAAGALGTFEERYSLESIGAVLTDIIRDTMAATYK